MLIFAIGDIEKNIFSPEMLSESYHNLVHEII